MRKKKIPSIPEKITRLAREQPLLLARQYRIHHHKSNSMMYLEDMSANALFGPAIACPFCGISCPGPNDAFAAYAREALKLASSLHPGEGSSL